MPSCVVKWCKNNTTFHKKCQGITFHRFPTGNEPWKNEWLSIIRNCRGQEDWISSKSSVVCSIHFDQNDLYSTSKGRRHVVTYAVPKLLLFEPPLQEEQPDVGPETTKSLRVVRRDHDQEQQSSLGSNQLLFEPPVKEEQPDVGPETTKSLRVVRRDYDQEQQSSLGSDQAPPPPIIHKIGSEQPSGTSTPLTSAQILPQPTIGLEAVNCEQLLLWDSPRKLRLKKIINKKNTLIDTQRKKIKSLNQKVRRLRNRNQSLKDILKKFKT